MRSSRAFLAFLVGSLIVTAPASGTTHVVGPGGSIQAAVDSAAAGDTVLVSAGTFEEQVQLKSDLVLKSASGAGVTTIDGGGTRARCLSAYFITNLVIEGFTFTGTDACAGGGAPAVEIYGSFTMSDCVFSNVAHANNSAPLVASGGSSVVARTLFERGSPAFCGGIDPAYGSAAILHGGGGGTLLVEDCDFLDNDSLYLGLFGGWGGSTEFRGCLFRNNASGNHGLFDNVGGSTLLIQGSLFLDHDGDFNFHFPSDVPGPTILQNNTFARNRDLFYGFEPVAGSLVASNVFTGASVGFQLDPAASGVAVQCNDSWGNGTNWKGFTPSPDNFSEDPLHCGPDVDDFTVAANSPLLPAHNSCGTLIGAFGQGCGPVSVVSETWGKIKSRYRE